MSSVKNQKVVCLGYQKTGTTTLMRAFQILGYKTSGFNIYNKRATRDFLNNDYEKLKWLCEKYEALQDVPFNLAYKEINQWYPDSKFILITRDSESWYRSFKKYYTSKTDQTYFKELYGVKMHEIPESKTHLISLYERHNAEVQEFFKGKSNFLQTDIKDLNWELLCNFLEKKIPKSRILKREIDFPHTNKTQKSKYNYLVRPFWIFAQRLAKKVGLYKIISHIKTTLEYKWKI